MPYKFLQKRMAKVVIPDKRSEIRDPEIFEPQMHWMPDRVRHDG